MSKVRKPNSEHVRIVDGKFKCLHCGEALTIPLPISVNMFVAMGKAFTKDHLYCKKIPSRPDHEDTTTIQQRGLNEF
jgi:hypothetical protein